MQPGSYLALSLVLGQNRESSLDRQALLSSSLESRYTCGLLEYYLLVNYSASAVDAEELDWEHGVLLQPKPGFEVDVHAEKHFEVVDS